MKPTVSSEARSRVLELRRSLSLRQVAEQTGLPLGTVKTICSRSGVFRDNPKLRELFALPPIQVSNTSELAVPELPPQQVVTGDFEVDAVLWLRSVIGTGQAPLIAKAMEAAKRIKTPLKVLEDRYMKHLVSSRQGNPFAAFSSFGFSDLEGLAEQATRKLSLKQEAAARFGDQLHENAPAEQFCIAALAGLKRGGNMLEFNPKKVQQRFEAQPDLLPQTLHDCLFELAYWSDLYQLRNAVCGYGDPAPEGYARECFVFSLLAKIRSRSKEESLAVFRYLASSERMDDIEADGILLNLIGGSS